jgi:ribonuclease P protein component
MAQRVRILAGPLQASASCCFWSRFGLHGADDEAHIQPEQSAPQASPWISCAHGHQGRPSGAEPPSREGPQAPRGLTAPRQRAAITLTARSFPRDRRLTDKPEFDAVHREGQRSSDALFLVIMRPSASGHARLGLAVGVKAAGNAVNRNRVKRLARESFRHRQQELPPMDLVVNARVAAGKATNAEIRASLAAHWDRIVRRCARS